MNKSLKHMKQALFPTCLTILFLNSLILGTAFAQDDFSDSYQATPFVESAPITNREELEDLVLVVAIEGSRLSEGVFALERDGVYYLPVRTLSNLFDFYIDPESTKSVIKGSVISKEDSFSINLETKKISYNSVQTNLLPIAYVDPSLTSDDMYIAADALAEIWPVQFEVDFSALVLRVASETKLPFQLALERKQRRENLRNRKETAISSKVDINTLPFSGTPYQLLGKPSIDLDLQAGYDGRIDGAEFRTSISGVQDLGFASADFSTTFTHLDGQLGKPENFRLRFRRQNIYPNALPLDLEDVQWGDVRLGNRDLISFGSSGRGLVFTNDTNNFETEFDEITVDGVARPGWETELYINDQLIDFGVVDASGEYRFEDVTVTFGQNEVKVILFGPQGQIEERVENYFYQSNLAAKGKFVYSGGLVEAERDLIEIDPRVNSRPQGLAANFYGAYGIGSRLTAFASANTIKDEDDRAGGIEEVARNYLSAGLVGSYGKTLAQLELYKELGGGEAVDLRTISDFKGFKLNSRVSAFNEFESPDARRGDQRQTLEYEFNVRRTVNTDFGSLGFDVGTEGQERDNGSSIRLYTSRQSVSVGGARITHSTRTNVSNNSHTSTNARLAATVREGNWRFRNFFNYNIFPNVEGTTVGVDARYGTSRDLSYGFNAQQNFSADETTLGFQITKDFEKFLGSFESDWSNVSGVSFLLRASAGLGPYGENDSYIARSDPFRTAGPINALVYLDRDYDGEFSEGDEPVEGTKLQLGPRFSREETDENGLFTELTSSVGSKQIVRVLEKSIDDPFIVSASDGIVVYPRPGVAQYVELGLVETGAIDGTLYGPDRKPFGGLDLQIMNSDAEIVQTSRTGSDGYFSFERIPPSSYTIRAAPDTGVSMPFKFVDLTPDNLFQFGIDIYAGDNNFASNGLIETEVGDDGSLNVKNILSIAKGFKERNPFIRSANAKAVSIPKTQNKGDNIQKVSAVAGDVRVRTARIGRHSDKERVVLDLNAPINYTIQKDPITNALIVDMPSVGWVAQSEFKARPSSRLQGYYIQELEQGGTRLVLQLAAAARLGKHGLLAPNAGKKDRLYIDVQ